MERRELPHGWAFCTLGDAGELVTGTTPPRKRTEFYGGDIPFVKPGDLDGVAPLLSASECVTAAGAAVARPLPVGSVLVSCIGNLGKTALLGTKAITNQQINSVVPSQAVDSVYLLHWCRTLKPWMEENASATTVSILNKGRFSSAPLVLAPLNEQRRIVQAIEDLQARSAAAKAALDAIPPLLEKFRQSVLASAFRGDLTKAWRARNPDVEPASVLLARIRAERRARWIDAAAEKGRGRAEAKARKAGKPWSAADDQTVLARERVKAQKKYVAPDPVDAADLPDLPEGWCWARAEEVCDWITKGTTPAKAKMSHRSGERPFVKVYNLTFTGDLDFTVDPTFVSESVHSSELARSRCFPGDVLMNIVGPPLGKVSILPNSFPEWNINQAISVFRPIRGLNNGYFAHHLMREWTSSRARRRAKATAGQFNLTLAICRGLPVPICGEREQLEVVRQVLHALEMASVGEHVASCQESVASLNQSILAKAFRGELVPQDPTDEPASVLLDRIRAERAAAEAAKPKKTRRRKPKKPVAEQGDLPGME